jgi:histidine triad (HIT) family protein
VAELDRFSPSDSVSGHETCLFCRIVRHEVPSRVVWEDDLSLAFLDHRPVFAGHTLLVPKQHVESLAELPDRLIAPVFTAAKLLSEAVQQGMHADGTFVAINNHVSQSVPHLHIHVVPRTYKDGLKGFFWPRHPYETEQAAQAAQEAIRSALATIRAENGLQ